MSVSLHCKHAQNYTLVLPETRIGADRAATLCVDDADLAQEHVALHWRDSLFWVENLAPDGHFMHVNGRRIHSASIVMAGDDLHLNQYAVQLRSTHMPSLERTNTATPAAFSDRVILRVRTGAEVGRSYSLVNSLSIGRSAISDVHVDDMALAERQILLQRQGNDILVKNLNPALEMKINGWPCTEAFISPGAQIQMEQHRFLLQASSTHLFESSLENAVQEPKLTDNEKSQDATIEVSKPIALFNRTQWLLLISALAVVSILVLLLTFAP